MKPENVIEAAECELVRASSGSPRGLDCASCDEHLIDYAYQELAEAMRSKVARHLADCPTCALAYCRLRADLDGVLEAVSEAPPHAVRRRLRDQLERSFGPSLWTRAVALWRRPVPAYGMVLASLVPVVFWLATALRATPVVAAAPVITSPPSRPPALIDYDSMLPLLPEDRPL